MGGGRRLEMKCERTGCEGQVCKGQRKVYMAYGATWSVVLSNEVKRVQ